MTERSNPLPQQVALVTGGALRIGARISRVLHAAGFDIAVHYRSSRERAETLQRELESIRPGSVYLVQADLLEQDVIPGIISQVAGWRGRLDLLVNNASSFYPSPIGEVDERLWNDLMGSNLKVPFFLSQAAAPLLRKTQGAIVNLVDIHAERPKKGFSIYSIAKAGNAMLVKSLARELGPEVRVNGVSPGAILWPEEEMSDATRELILSRTALARTGTPDDIARTVLFLARDACYITGQIIAVDGGRSVQQ